jgi:hypothetical protein
MKAPAALFDASGRKKLAKLLVWGSDGKLLERSDIEVRIEKALSRIAEKVEKQ